MLTELRIAIADPASPDVEHKDKLDAMIQSHDEYLRVRRQLSERRTQENIERIDNLEAAYYDWNQTYILNNPEMQSFWFSVIQPESNL